MTSLGVVFVPQFPPERLRSVVRAADEAGLEQLWLWEDCFLESGIATAAAALAWSDRLRVAVGLLPVPLRNVALTAMEVATLNRLFPGRVDVAVGHGVQRWMAQVGAQVESPLTLLREHLEALRGLLDGRTVTMDGRYVSLDAVALDWPPATPPSLLAGATGPRSLRLCGEAADGTILSGGTTLDQARQARRRIAEGQAAGGRSGVPHPVTVYVHAATGPDALSRLDAERVRAGYDSMDEIGIAGDAAQFAAAIGRWADAGVDTVVLQPTPDEPDLEGFVRFVATQVAPLVPVSEVP